MLPFRGGTFLSELASTFGRYCDPVIAVFGANADELMARAPETVRCVKNDNYKEGMLTSLQAGLRELPRASGQTVLFTLVDHPAIGGATVEALLGSALLGSSGAIAIPRFEGKRGHPVALRGTMIDEILAEPASSRIHDVIDRHAGEIVYVDVNDSGIRDDIDDPEQYRQLMMRQAEPA